MCGRLDKVSEVNIKQRRLIPLNEEDWFKEELEFFWNQGFTAQQIHKKMELKDQYQLQVWQVYYLASKYGLKKRNNKRKPRVC